MSADFGPREPLGPTGEQVARMRDGIRAAIAADRAATRRRRGRGWAIGGTLGLLAVLAGGTSVAMAAGALQAPGWLMAAGAPATATPAATPAAPSTVSTTSAGEHTGKPLPRVAITCPQLLPLATVAGVMGDGAQVSSGDLEDFDGTPDALDSVISDDAARARGALRCFWGAPSHLASLTVTVTPTDVVDPAEHTGVGYLKLGDLPELGAGASDWRTESGGVIVDVPVGGQLLEVGTNGFGSPAAPGDAIAAAQSLTRAAQGRLSGAPAPAQASPAPRRVSAGCAAVAESITQQPGTGVLALSTQQSTWAAHAFDFTANGGLDCAFTHTSAAGAEPAETQVLYLPGGAWNWPQLAQLAPPSLALSPVADLGDAALAGCVNDVPDYSASGSVCDVEVRVGDSWLHVRVETADRAAAVAIARSVNDEITRLAG